MNHKTRIAIAERLKQKILRRYGDNVLGIAIYGSVAKNEDHRYSDLEMYVITKRKLEKRESRYVYRGMPVEISYIPEREMLRRARRVSPDWPLVHDFYCSYLILHEKDAWFTKLERAVLAQDPEGFKKSIKKSLVWLNELVGKIKSAYFHDDHFLFSWLTSFLGWESILFMGLVNQRYYKSERYFFKTVFEFPLLPRDYRSLLEMVFRISTTDRKEIYQAALTLFEEMNRLGHEKGITVEQGNLET
jgi:predicted nucleotidyltransferase